MPPPAASIKLPEVTNPFSLQNIEKAKAALSIVPASKSASPQAQLTGTEPQFVYFKFDPQNLSQDQFLALESDSTVTLMEIPFANMAIYGDAFALDNTKAEQLKDGNVYGVTSITNSNVFTKLASNQQTGFQRLDTLVQVSDADTALQYQAFREAGFAESQINQFKICLFKRPHGYVRYWDNQYNRLEPVRGMQVWSLFLGIPIYSYTDGNGYYDIPWRFSIGSIMGTKAKNPRINVKPFDTHGSLFRTVYTFIAQFVTGSIHIEGWVTPCQMRDGKDFNFYGHTQVRYWSQILNAYYWHDVFTTTDRINSAPNQMVCYAQWANTTRYGTPITDVNGVPDFGDASAFMLGHVNLEMALVELFLNDLFDADVNLATNFPNVLQLLTGLLPDMSFRVPRDQEPAFYNSRFAQIAFHELAHASHFRQVGNLWWLNLGRAEIPKRGVSGNPYGDGNYTNAGHVALTESWAEFIGMNYQLRLYAAIAAWNTCTNRNTYLTNVVTGATQTVTAGNFYNSPRLIENQDFFYGGRWIPLGVYHDLMDNTNTSPNNSAETWDAIRGVSIKQLYEAFGPLITDMCSYLNNFSMQNPGLNQTSVFNIFDHHNAACY